MNEEQKAPFWDKFGTLGDTLGGLTVFITGIAGLLFVITNCRVKAKFSNKK